MTRSVMIAVVLLLLFGGCMAPYGQQARELPVVHLRQPATGKTAQCGVEFVHDVVVYADLSWLERVAYGHDAARRARQALRDEDAWREQCQARLRQQGFEVVSR